MGLLEDRLSEAHANAASTPLPKCHFFNSFFYPKLCIPSYNYANVRRWTRKVKLFDKDKVFIPINLNNMHWCLACINFREKRFEYYDSMGGRRPEILAALRRYVIDEAKDKLGKTMSVDEWEDYSPRSIPQQEDGSSCGVFSCKFADYASTDSPFSFSQRNIANFRMQMAFEILEQRCLD
mmetsp:Transcript_8210/g.13317  ORF Transcript_8210/g.13317 Transcript_8210/m.13317 type:complete len:180 (-) Transcript_8210:516-1055(-)